jgi:hypothetical protein
MRRIAILVVAALALAGSAYAADCTKTSVALTPLADLKGTYHGYAGGLYPNRRNTPSPRYLAAGEALTKQIVPRDATGAPAADGRIVLLTIGMSNTTQESQVFVQLARASSRQGPHVTIVDGAQGGQDAEKIKAAAAPYWQLLTQRLRSVGVTDAQVQAVWLKQAIIRPTEPFPADAQRLERDLVDIVGILRSRFANLRAIYVSSRTYAGYATTDLNPEPYAYQSGFAVRWLIGRRIDARLSGPWIGWGPYLWTNGTNGRSDGLVWQCTDTRAEDGTHPSPSGRAKVAQLLLRFFTSDPTARGWFSA